MRKILIYTVHKSASMFLHKLTSEVTNTLNIDYYSINNDVDHNLIKSQSWKGFIENKTEIACFGPIRAGMIEPNIPSNIESYSILLHLRDPRDVLTSLFFSHTYSHSKREGRFNPSDETRKKWEDNGIDQFVIEKTPWYKQGYETLCTHILDRNNTVFIKYEDMVYNYKKWLDEFLSAFYLYNSSTPINLNTINYQIFFPKFHKKLTHIKLYYKHKNDFRVKSEDIYKHRRQITPGDHKRKLSRETIEFLNQEFKNVLIALKYEI